MHRYLFQALLFLSLPMLQGSLSAQDLNSREITIHFEVDRSEISARYREQIRSEILDIGFGKIREICIEGHTDSDHTDDYNMDLSARRAAETKSFLLSQGVGEHLIHISTFGESRPAGSSKSENRRCVIRFAYFDDLAVTASPLWLKLHTVDAHTGKALPADYTLEQGGKLSSGRTDKWGRDLLLYQRHIGSVLIASHRGYLNQKADLSLADRTPGYDTVEVELRLHRVEVVRKLSFKNIFFHTDSDSLKSESAPELQKLLAVLQQNQDLYIEIQGHMNYPQSRPMGPDQQLFNYNLSYKRARRIYNYLTEHGIAAERLTYKGLSNTRMVYPEPGSRAEEDANKRVEIWTLRKINETAP